MFKLDPATRVANAMSIDVEDYFQVSAFERTINRDDWDRIPCRVEANVDRIMQLLADRNVRATFFTLGWLAERYPAMIRRIVDAGHELASHGYGHQRVTDLTPEQFKQDLLRAKKLLQDHGQCEIIGYRAPSFSIGPTNLWAHDVLAQTGHRYSSSVYPIAHDHYGMPDAPRFAYRPRPDLLEIPPTSIRLMARNLPASGGGFFRLLPYAVSRWSLTRVNRVDRESGVFYFHPWEVDPAQPRVAGASAKARFRHYLNLGKTIPRLERLLTDFRWDRMDRVFAAQLRA